MKKIDLLSLVVLLFSCLLSFSTDAQAQTTPQSAGDDPGITIHSPKVINSQGLIDLDITLAASAGKLIEDGKINVAIPKNIVGFPEQLISMIRIADPFYLDETAPADDGNGNYILSIKYDASKINSSEAVGYTFTVEFRAPYFIDHVTVPENLNFGVSLDISQKNVSNDSNTSITHPDIVGCPAFLKYSEAPSLNNEGVLQYIMSPTDPQQNNFVIIFNYNHQDYEDVTIEDTMPAGLSLADSYPTFKDAPGDPTRSHHLYIYRVTVSDSGKVTNPTLVTDAFAQNIRSTPKTFSLHLGKVKTNESYVVTYGASVDPDYDVNNFGVQYNQATLTDNKTQLYGSNTPLIMQSKNFSSTSLLKKVNQPNLATTSSSLVYTLTLNNFQGNLKAGTVVSDPLPDHVQYDSTLVNTGFSKAVYDKSNNTVSYTLLNDIPQGENRELQIKVNFNNGLAHINDRIINKASYTYAGSAIYSNDVVTILSGSANLQKLDILTGHPLSGAIFKVVDKEGNIIRDHLVSDFDGNVSSGLLAPGLYSFIETQAPSGYILDSTPNNFEVKDGQSTPVKLAMYNSQETDIKGTKTWIDNNNIKGLRPINITIELYRNSLKIKVQKTSKMENWKYSFSHLPKYDRNGKEYVYTVKEIPVKNYKAEQKGFDFTNRLITDSISTKPTTPKSNKSSLSALPKTGEHKNRLILWGIMILLSGVSFIYISKYRKRK